MNILPLIIGFIIVFSCLSMTFFKESRSITIAERSIGAAFRIETQLHNRLALRSYASKAHVNRSKSNGVKKTKPAYYSMRAISPPLEESKLNISALFDDTVIDVHHHPLYPIAAELIRTLYEGSVLLPEKVQKGWEKAILDAMIAKGKKNSQRERLTDLFPDDSALQATYYKMLKGTNQFELGAKKKGIAPLGNFLSMRTEKKENAIHFCFASAPLLQAAFGSKITDKLLAEEKKQWDATGKRYLSSKEDLQELLLQDAALANLITQLEPFLSFRKQIPRKSQIAGSDKATGLVLTREIL
ncbi:MAG: hypothetical protein AB7H48_08805 [Parachlamydiales bacterium]